MKQMSKITNPTTESSVSCGFFHSDPIARDRKYTAEDFCKLLDGVITNGIFANIGECLIPVAAGGNTVSVGSGKAWFNQVWIENDAPLPIDCGISETAVDRIDAIVIEVNTNDDVRDAFIKYIPGELSTTGVPERPVMSNSEGKYQHALCYIYRPAGSTEILDTDITIVVGKEEETPFVTSILETGTIEGYFSSWEEQFVNWFDNLKVQLEGDVAANLQNQIDNIHQDLTELEANTRLVDNSAFRLIAEYKVPGTYTWTPDDNKLGFVVIVGAGGSGAQGHGDYAQSSTGGGGGGGGCLIISPLCVFTPDNPVNIVVGAGGKVNDTISQYGGGRGYNGESSSALGIAAHGGKGGGGGEYSSNSSNDGGYGGDPNCPYIYYNSSNSVPEDLFMSSILIGGSGGYGARYEVNPGTSGESYNTNTANPYFPGYMLIGCTGGGGGGKINGNQVTAANGLGIQGEFGKSGDGASSIDSNGEDGGIGCGGGGGYGSGQVFNQIINGQDTVCYKYTNGGKGGDGYVAIYELTLYRNGVNNA